MFSRFLRRRAPRPTPADAARQSASRLALELLENRVAFAVTVGLDAEQNLVVTGDGAKDSVVIEERGVGNVEKWVFVNGKLATPGGLLATGGKVIVDLQGGDDSLVINAGKGGSYVDASIRYYLELGAGNDQFTFLAGDVTNSELLFDKLNGGDGRERFTLSFEDLAGSTVGLADGAFVNLGAGDDRVSLRWATATDSELAFGPSGAAPVGFDLGLGKDRIDVAKGNVTGGSVSIAIDLGDYFAAGGVVENGKEQGNYANITGNAVVTDATVTYAVYGGSDRDSVTYDDDRVVGQGVDLPDDGGSEGGGETEAPPETRVVTTFDLGAGHDALTVVTDGDRRGSIDDLTGATWELDAELGADRDKFTQTITPRSWSLASGAEFHLDADGGSGDDKMSVFGVKQTLNLDGVFDLIVEGGGGDDNLAVNFTNILRTGGGFFNVEVRGTGDDPSPGSGNKGGSGDDDLINVSANFLAASTPNSELEGGGPGSPDYVPTVNFVLEGENGGDHVQARIKNFSTTLKVRAFVEAGDDRKDKENEHYEGDVEVLNDDDV